MSWPLGYDIPYSYSDWSYADWSGPSRSNWMVHTAQSDAFLPADVIRVDFLIFAYL